MTDQLFQSDSFVREFDARVASVTDELVVLDRTVFYPGGAGQPYDMSTLSFGDANARVTKVSRKDGEIVHECDGPLPEVAARVTGSVDWENRYALMRTHTARHILCGVIWRDFDASVTDGAMASLAARMDFEFKNMTADFAEHVEALANAEIAAERNIDVSFLPCDAAFAHSDLICTKINRLHEGILEVRVVDISGLDVQANGGTHVANTRDPGKIRIVGHESKGRINKRLRLVTEDA